MPRQRLDAAYRFSIGLSALLCLAAPFAGGCEGNPLGLRKGATSIFQAMQPPTPEEAARWAIDPFDPDKRYRGTLLLANAPYAGESPYIALFRDNSDDQDPGVRAAATRGLGTHGAPEDATIIIARLSDEDPSVRTEAARALQRIYNPASVPPLLERLRPAVESEPEVRMQAARALGQYQENRVVEALIASLVDENLAVNLATQDSLRTLTGQDYGFDRAAWQRWYRGQQNAFAARSVYTFPVYQRGRRWYEYLPFIPGPPNESTSTPAGYPNTFE